MGHPKHNPQRDCGAKPTTRLASAAWPPQFKLRRRRFRVSTPAERKFVLCARRARPIELAGRSIPKRHHDGFAPIVTRDTPTTGRVGLCPPKNSSSFGDLLRSPSFVDFFSPSIRATRFFPPPFILLCVAILQTLIFQIVIGSRVAREPIFSRESSHCVFRSVEKCRTFFYPAFLSAENRYYGYL